MIENIKSTGHLLTISMRDANFPALAHLVQRCAFMLSGRWILGQVGVRNVLFLW